MKTKFSIFTVFKIAFLVGLVAVVCIPFIHMAAVSLSDAVHVIRNQVSLFPKGFTLDMYKYVINDPRISTAYLNTLLYVVTGTAVSMAITSTGSYAASRDAMMFRGVFIKLIIICMFFSGGMVPSFLVVMRLGIIDTVWGVILPGAVNMWFFVIMMTLFKSIPKELEDSAKIDGIGDIGVFWYIALPLSKATVAAVGLFYAIGIWNDFTTPMLYLNSQSRYPLTLLLRNMIIANTGLSNQEIVDAGSSIINENSLKYATLMVSVLPIMCVYPFLQKYFVSGIMVGSIKG